MTDQPELSHSVDYATDTRGKRPQPGLARDLSELARQLHAQQSLEQVLNRIAHAAVAEVEAAEYAGITEVSQGQVSTRAATAPVVQLIDEAQYRSGEGPCLDALQEHTTVRADDLSHETRWPRFSREAAENGMHSVLSVQLFVEADKLGALNLYSSTPNAFGVDDEGVAIVLAAHAAVAMKGSKVESNLRTALASRDVIGQAKGILMERFKLNAVQAFDLLVYASQQAHRKLREVAEDLAATGELSYPT